MRFIHIADVHLGASPDAGSAYSPKRTQEIWNSFASIIEKCKESNVEVLFVAGDLFHRQPLLRELKEVNYLFMQIPSTHIFLMAGNHDYMKHDSYYRTFSWADNVHMFAAQEIEVIEIPELELAVYGCSYEAKEITESIYDTAVAKGKQRYQVLLAHGGDEKHIPMKKNEIMSLGYNYVALGHIHKQQDLIPGKAIYAGALEPIDKNDVGKHGYVEGEIDQAGVKAVFVPSATREYIHSEIVVKDQMTGYELKALLADTIKSTGIQNIYKITLTGFRDPEILFDLQDMDKYGNIIEIIDSTTPAYDFERLYQKNKDNLVGKFIESLIGNPQDSVEFGALCEGIEALMQTRRG